MHLRWKGLRQVINITYEFFEKYDDCFYVLGPTLYETRCGINNGIGIYYF